MKTIACICEALDIGPAELSSLVESQSLKMRLAEVAPIDRNSSPARADRPRADKSSSDSVSVWMRAFR